MDGKILKVTFNNTSKTEEISIRAIKLDPNVYNDVNFYVIVGEHGEDTGYIKMVRKTSILSEQEENNAENV